MTNRIASDHEKFVKEIIEIVIEYIDDKIDNYIIDLEIVRDKFLINIDTFNAPYFSLPDKLKSIEELTQSQANGVQNVYNKFLELEKRQTEIEEIFKKYEVIQQLVSMPIKKRIKMLFAKDEI